MTSTIRHERCCLWTVALLALALLASCQPNPRSSSQTGTGAENTRTAVMEKRGGMGQYAPVNGLRLYYEIHGAARSGAQPLVLLHGGGSTLDTTFGKVLEDFARTRQVIAFDQQGHGRTNDVPERPFSFEQTADDTAALLRYLEIGSADLLGWSNGGSAAMQVAIRHPALVRKLVVASAMVRRDGLPPEFWGFMREASLDNMPAELKEAYVRASPHPERLQSFHDKSVERMLNFTDWTQELVRSIHAHTLVMIADGDIVRPEHAVEMFRLLPRAQLAILPGSDHDFINRYPERVVTIVTTFLDQPLPGVE